MKKIFKLLIILFLLYIILQLLVNSYICKEAILYSFDIFKKNVFPNLFPFLVISNLLINYGFIELCSNCFGPILKRMFRISTNASFIFIMSLVSGFPSNAKYTRDLYLNGSIDDIEGTKILMFTHFSNPLFIIGTISVFLSLKYAFIILFCHYISNIIIGLLFRNSLLSSNNKEIIPIKSENFGLCLSKSILNSINTLLLIFGTINVFMIIMFLINSKLNLTPFYNSIFSGFLEMTQGLNAVSLLNISDKIKSILMVSFLSFGGLSVHMQVISIISDTKIKYGPFLIARLLHTAISVFLVYLII